jgi:hypothetical protein
LADIEERERTAVISDLGLTEAEAGNKTFNLRIHQDWSGGKTRAERRVFYTTVFRTVM